MQQDRLSLERIRVAETKRCLKCGEPIPGCFEFDKIEVFRCPNCDALFEDGKFVCYGAKTVATGSAGFEEWANSVFIPQHADYGEIRIFGERAWQARGAAATRDAEAVRNALDAYVRDLNLDLGKLRAEAVGAALVQAIDTVKELSTEWGFIRKGNTIDAIRSLNPAAIEAAGRREREVERLRGSLLRILTVLEHVLASKPVCDADEAISEARAAAHGGQAKEGG